MTAVTVERVEPEPILYHRGTVLVTLTGLNAWIYRAQVIQYGEKEATERFWWLWHKKAVTAPADTAFNPARGN